MKRILPVVICICMMCPYFINVSYADIVPVNDFLCGSFAVIDSSSNALVKNYHKQLSKNAVIENGKMFINVSDLELWGADVSVGKNEIRIIYREFSVNINISEDFYCVNGEVVSKNILNHSDFQMIDLEEICKVLNLKYCLYDDVAIMYDGVEINDDIKQSVYNTMSDLKNPGTMLELYVSPDGNDSSSGSETRPFKTINRAKEYVKKIIQSGMSGDIYIYIGDGIYNERLDFSASDSGRGQYRVIYKGIGDGAVITQEEKVTSWESVDGQIYRAYIGKNREINSVLENDEMGTKARFPNEDYAYATGEGKITKSGFSYDCELPDITDISKLEAYVWSGGPNAWAADTIPVTAIDTENKYIAMASDAAYDMTKTSRFYLQGALEFLDLPGEFFYDGEYLYYCPKNLPIENTDISIAGESALINFEGVSRENPVCNITVSNMQIKNTDRDADAVTIQNARNIEITECRIKNIGGNGVSMSDYALANRIEGCEITNIGKNGIVLSNNSSGNETFSMNGKYNEILNTHINGVGKTDGDSSGVSIATGYNMLKNCVIQDGKRMGVSICSTRPGVLVGQTVEGVLITRENARLATHSQNNTVMFCEIFDFMRDSQDGGAVYSWGGDYDNVICYNHIHDVCSPFSFSFGLYLDDGADGFTVKNNIIENLGTYKEGTVYAAIFTKGSYNKVYNNITANNENALYAYMTQTMVMEPCDYLEYSNNIMYNSGGGAYLHKSYDINRMRDAQNNIYYSDNKNYSITGIDGITDLYEWKEYLDNKYDSFSLIHEDPGFYDTGDYRLKYDSPAGKLGISDIDMGKIGLLEEYPFSGEFSDGKLFIDTSDERISGSTIDLSIGDEIKCDIFMRSDAGHIKTVENALIEISDNSVARYENGKIIAVNKGKTEVRITSANSHTAYDILVGDTIQEILIEADSILYEDHYSRYNIYAVTEFGRYTKCGGKIVIDTLDKNIASVAKNGEIIANAQGKTSIIATYGSGNKTISSEHEIEVVGNVIFEESFDDENMWISDDSRYAKLDESIFHDGTKSAAITGSTGTLTYNGDTGILSNNAYEFWFYDDMNDGTALMELSGLNSSGGLESIVFGVKINAYNKYYVANQTQSTNVLRSEGWHHVVLDMTVDYKITVYIDSKETDIKNYTHRLKDITGLRIINLWYAGGTLWKYNFDSLKVYKSISDVPKYRDDYLKVFFDDRTADNAQDIGIDNGAIRIEYTHDMKEGSYFELFERPIESHDDSDYVKTECLFWTDDPKNITISPQKLNSNSSYRLYMKNQQTIDSVKIADDFIEFSTGEIEQNIYDPIKSIVFDNGAVLPVNGAAEYFGNITVNFSLDMDTDSLAENIFIVSDENKKIDCSIDVYQDKAIIILDTEKIEQNKKYYVVIGKNAKTIGQNYIAEDHITYFNTSEDLKIQQKQFYDSFENGLKNWLGDAAVRNDMSHSGEYCVGMEKNTLEFAGNIPPNGVYEYWMYDTNISSDSCLIMEIRGQDENGNDSNIRFGQKNGYSEYIISNGDNNLIMTGVERSTGWHRFTVDFTDHQSTEYYIDGEAVAVRNEPVKYAEKIIIGNYWNYGEYGMCLDDVSIWNDMDADVFERFAVDDLTVVNMSADIPQFGAGDRVRISMDINNITKEDINGILIFAAFDDNKLYEIAELKNFFAYRNSSIDLQTDHILPDNFESLEYKLYVFDSLEGMRPLYKTQTIEFN